MILQLIGRVLVSLSYFFLIQIGGLGVCHCRRGFCYSFSGRKIGLMQKLAQCKKQLQPLMWGDCSSNGISFGNSSCNRIVRGCFSVSGIFVKNLIVEGHLVLLFFHSISAFCNAGFDLMGIKAAVFIFDGLCN